MLRFKCPKCKKQLRVKPEMAGKRAACPGCKHPFVVPTPQKPVAARPKPVSADVEKLAADFLTRSDAGDDASQSDEPVKLTCQYCDEEVEFEPELAGKQAPCPACRRIIKIPLPKKGDKPQNWREGTQAGPKFTKDNIEDKLDDAWSTADRTGVHQGSMEEAGALPDEKTPVTMGTWVRRGAIFVGIVGVLVGAYFGAAAFRSVTVQKKSLEKALQLFGSEDLKGKIPPSWRAEFRRAAGEYYTRKNQSEYAEKARDQFDGAYSEISATPNLEQELLLLSIALSQIELGGPEEAVIDKRRIGWGEVQKNLNFTLASIRTEEGKLFALRRVCFSLLNKGQGETAQALAKTLDTDNSRAGQHSAWAAEQIAILLAMNNANLAKRVMPPPTGKELDLPLAVRFGYAEGMAHQGNYKRAHEIANQPGIVKYRLMAQLAIADVALSKGNLKQAKTSLGIAMNTATKVIGQKNRIPPLVRYQIVDLQMKLGSPETAMQWAKSIRVDPGCRFMAELEVLRDKIRTGAETLDPQAQKMRSLAHALAVELQVRSNPSLLNDALADNPEELHPLIYIAAALAEQGN